MAAAKEERGARRGRPEGVRQQALDVVLHSFAEAVQADTAVLVEGLHAPGAPPHLLAGWDRAEPGSVPAWTLTTLIARALEGERAVVRRSGPRDGGGIAELAVPARIDGRNLGALQAAFAIPSRREPEHLCGIANAYGGLAALCIDGDPTLPHAISSSAYDRLTGCLTYAELGTIIEAEMERSMRHEHALSCCFVDLDGFKAINDQKGHLEGNRVLAAVGRALRSSARAYDAVGRFGGDEFVILLPETGAAEAEAVANRMSAECARGVSAETSSRVTVSVGIAEWDGKSSVAGLLDAADAALNGAKRAR